MSEARALTNIIGNGVATIVVARWENELDRDRLQSELLNPPSAADLDDDLALERSVRASETGS
jgi:aerobic C4-dicarboxylate transport protein